MPHQFGDRDRRMGVVELDGGMVGQRVERAVFVEMAADEVLQRGGGEEILLPQPQFLALGRGVVGIEHARDRLGAGARRGGADQVAVVERGQLQRRGRARRPQPQRVDVAAAPAGDRRVVRHRQHRLGRIPDRARGRLVAAEIFDDAAETDGVARFAVGEFPRIAVRQPLLRKFVLPAVLDALLEQPVLVADAVAVSRNAERRHRVHEAGGQPPEPAIAECGVRLDLAQSVEIDAERGERAPRRSRSAACC